MEKHQQGGLAVESILVSDKNTHMRFQFCSVLLDLIQTLQIAVHESLDVIVVGDLGIFQKNRTRNSIIRRWTGCGVRAVLIQIN